MQVRDCDPPSGFRLMRVIVTGGSGFIGREVVQRLVAAKYEVHTLGRSRESRVPETFHHNVDLLKSDDLSILSEVRAPLLVHLAWYTEPGQFWRAPENLDWVAASLSLIHGFVANGGRRAFVAGTCAEYGWRDTPLDEQAPIEPNTLYGRAKASLHDLLSAAAPCLGLSLAWGRIFFPFGPGESPSRLFGRLLAAMMDERPVEVSEGSQRRDFIHVQDVATAIVAILESRLEGPVNIASGQSIPVRQFVELAAAAAGIRDRIVFGAIPLQEGEPPLIAGMVDRLLTQTSYNPQFSISERIALSIDEFRRDRKLHLASR